jgi:PAS domain-containing protein
MNGPIFDDAGRLIEIQSAGRDLTEQHEARQLLVESEERYRRLFNSLPVAVWENDWTDVMNEIARRDLILPGKLADAVAKDHTVFYELGSTVRVTTSNPAALAMAGVTTLEEFDRWLASAATSESAVRYAAEAMRSSSWTSTRSSARTASRWTCWCAPRARNAGAKTG